MYFMSTTLYMFLFVKINGMPNKSKVNDGLKIPSYLPSVQIQDLLVQLKSQFAVFGFQPNL